MFKKMLISISIFSVVLLLSGCPYSSQVPIAKAQEKTPKTLFGAWNKVETSDNPAYVTIEREEGNWATLKKFAYSSDSSKYVLENSYTLHVTTVDKALFLNMKNDGSYLLYRVNFNEDKNGFELFEVTDNIDEKFETSEELMAFIKKYKDLSFFYNKDEEKYTRKSE